MSSISRIRSKSRSRTTVRMVFARTESDQQNAPQNLCWNCREPGHMAAYCPNEGICHICGKAGHRAKKCDASPLPLMKSDLH